MKKCLLLILVPVCTTMLVVAKNLTPFQINLRNEIQIFLDEEGFVPEIDADEDISFKYEGSTYYVSISETDESPMYVDLFKVFNYPEDYSPEIFKIAAIELNKYKGVKVVCSEKSFSIHGSMYIVSAESFKYAFYKLMSQMAYVREDILGECAKVGGSGGEYSSRFSNYIPFVISAIEVANADINGNVIQSYGSTIYEYNTQFLQPRITVLPLKTSSSYMVYVRLYQNGIMKSGSTSPKGYTFSYRINISASSTSTTITLPGWGSTTSGYWKVGEYRYEIWYGDYCVGSKSFYII